MGLLYGYRPQPLRAMRDQLLAGGRSRSVTRLLPLLASEVRSAAPRKSDYADHTDYADHIDYR